MNLTKESEYALRGLGRLASYPMGSMVPHSVIADAEGLPTAFLAKIFQKLARHGVLEAERGRGSGYALRQEPEALCIREVIEAVEGTQALERCLLWGGHCTDREPCPLHRHLQPVHDQLGVILSRITLADHMSGGTPNPSESHPDPGATQ